MSSRLIVWVLMVGLSMVSSAQAHFVWLHTVASGVGREVRVTFGEATEPGEASLIDRIAKTQVTVSTQDGDVIPLELSKVVDEAGETAWLSGRCPEQAGGQIAARCQYGIFTKGDQPMLLNYYAKCPLDPAARTLEPVGGELLPLEVLSESEATPGRLKIVWRGQPAVGAQVVLTDPSGETLEKTTDADGAVLFPISASGRYQVRARWVEDRSGESDGQPFSKVLHYCTATWSPNTQPTTSSTDKVSAAEALAQARTSRAIWQDFPGFTAKVLVRIGNREQAGTIAVDRDGDIELRGVDLEEDSSVYRSLKSLVSHRLGSGVVGGEASYVDGESHHPLGTLVDINDSSAMGSTYRIDGDVIRQVNRQMGPRRMTISVIDVYRNPQGQTIPASYQVLFWEPDGALASSTLVRDQWCRVGDYDLPLNHFFIEAATDAYEAIEIKFSDHRLTDDESN